jgi:hypothetical protein
MKRHLPSILVVLAFLAVLTTVVLAQGSYAMTRSVIAGGGGVSIGGQYDLQGTVGQPVTGTSAQGDYGVSSGFWSWLESFFDVCLPLVLRNSPQLPVLMCIKELNPSHPRLRDQSSEEPP